MPQLLFIQQKAPRAPLTSLMKGHKYLTALTDFLSLALNTLPPSSPRTREINDSH